MTHGQRQLRPGGVHANVFALATEPALRRELGQTAVAAVVVGNMLGSGIFFTPGELASVARSTWQIYFFWGLCGAITLCGALTLAELSSLLSRPGATYHIIQEGFGPFWAFLKVWMEMWVSGPGSVAGVAIVFGEFLTRFPGVHLPWSAAGWGVAAITLFAAINLLGVRWGGRTQILLTSVKVAGILALVGGSLWLASPVAPAPVDLSTGAEGLLSFIRLVGLGVAAVMFTYDGWIDVTHVAGEVSRPERNLPRGLAVGVGGITALYLIVNYAYLRVVPLDRMREAPTAVAAAVARASFGPTGASLLDGLIVLSIFGALGGLVMTLPRLYYAAAAQYGRQDGARPLRLFFRALALVSPKTTVPAGAIVFCAGMSIVALLFFGSFGRLVTFFVVPLQLANILMVAAVFRLRPRTIAQGTPFLTPGYPLVPAIYIVVIGLFLSSAIYFRPVDTLIGVTLTATGVPAYFWVGGRKQRWRATASDQPTGIC